MGYQQVASVMGEVCTTLLEPPPSSLNFLLQFLFFRYLQRNQLHSDLVPLSLLLSSSPNILIENSQ